MDDEQKRILRMVAEGKITSDEAAGLLDALEEVSAGDARRMSPAGVLAANGQAKTLVIQVSEGDESKVNVRIPLGLARAAGRFIPRRAQEYLEEYDIDIPQLVQDIGGSIQRGPIIDVRDDDEHVVIAVE